MSNQKPRLLDLFCGAGGCTAGYQRAGFWVRGVDLHRQPRHVGEQFVQADALEYLAGLIESGEIEEFDAIHASPPCQAHSSLKTLTGKNYQCFISATRSLLRQWGGFYVIENVAGAPLTFPILLCGSAFGLGVRRHRIFESNVFMLSPGCIHSAQPEPIDVTGTGGFCEGRIRVDRGGGNSRKPRNIAEARQAMGIDWMTRPEISQAIPPAYTHFIGNQLIAVIQNARRIAEKEAA